MKRILKASLKVLLIILVLLILTALTGYFYFNSNVLGFETKYADENFDLQEITVQGRKFFDRNVVLLFYQIHSFLTNPFVFLPHFYVFESKTCARRQVLVSPVLFPSDIMRFPFSNRTYIFINK